MTKWTKEYNNDTGPCDDYFEEWWNVTDGSHTYRCNNSEDADFLIKTLAQPELNPERFNNWIDIDNIKDHVRILEQRVDFMRERIEAMQKQEPAAWSVRTIGGRKWHSVHASKGASDKWLEYRIKEQAQSEEYEQVALYTKEQL